MSTSAARGLTTTARTESTERMARVRMTKPTTVRCTNDSQSVASSLHFRACVEAWLPGSCGPSEGNEGASVIIDHGCCNVVTAAVTKMEAASLR
jgi:hypothetical protein